MASPRLVEGSAAPLLLALLGVPPLHGLPLQPFALEVERLDLLLLLLLGTCLHPFDLGLPFSPLLRFVACLYLFLLSTQFVSAPSLLLALGIDPRLLFLCLLLGPEPLFHSRLGLLALLAHLLLLDAALLFFLF